MGNVYSNLLNIRYKGLLEECVFVVKMQIHASPPQIIACAQSPNFHNKFVN